MIQQHTYDAINRHRTDRHQDLLAPKYSGQWRASNLIKQIIFTVSTNCKSETSNFTPILRILNIIQTTKISKAMSKKSGIDARQNPTSFQKTDQALFRKSLLERLQDPNSDTVDLVYKYNKHIKEQQNSQGIREFYTASKPIQAILKRN